MDKYITTVLVLYLIVVFSGYYLEYLNLSHLNKFGSIIPASFEGYVDQALLDKTRNYIIENTRFGIISSIFHNIILLLFLFGSLFNIYNSWIASLNLQFILSGIVFFLLLFYAETLLTIPFNLYHTFKIENKYGFTTMTFKLWLTDFIKSLIISTILVSIITSAGLAIIQGSPDLWWFWVWCLFLGFSVIIMYIFPYVIEPLFNKFTPIEEESLRKGIQILMQKVGIHVKRVLKMDASKRTKHTNAYFTGIGKVKRIVLYDTLLEKLNSNEILATLGHEAGHWKKRHLLKHLIVSEFIAFISMYVAFKILQGENLNHLFYIKEGTFFTKVIVLGFIGTIISFPFKPVFNYFSRRHETEADRFSCELTDNTQDMTTALVKLSKDNLSNLYPHPYYVKFYYSHPPVLDRIRKMSVVGDRPSVISHP